MYGTVPRLHHSFWRNMLYALPVANDTQINVEMHMRGQTYWTPRWIQDHCQLLNQLEDVQRAGYVKLSGATVLQIYVNTVRKFKINLLSSPLEHLFLLPL